MALRGHSYHRHSNVRGGAAWAQFRLHMFSFPAATLGLHWIIKLEEASYKHSLHIYKPCFAVSLPGWQSFTTHSTIAPSRQRHSHCPFYLWLLFLLSLKSKFGCKTHTITLITESAHRECSAKGLGSLHAIMPAATSESRDALAHLPTMYNF